MFEPLSWMHPQRLPLTAGFRHAQSRSVINDMIIEARGWSSERPVSPLNGLARHFVGQWTSLPQVALLIACQRYRASLARQGRLMALPLWLRSFAQLHIVDSSVASLAAAPDYTTLLAWGKHEIMNYGQICPWP